MTSSRAARNDGTAGPPVRVLPAYAVVLFVQTNYVFRLVGGAAGINEHAVKVLEFCASQHGPGVFQQKKLLLGLWYLDEPETVTLIPAPDYSQYAQVAQPTISEVECLLPVPWSFSKHALLSQILGRK